MPIKVVRLTLYFHFWHWLIQINKNMKFKINGVLTLFLALVVQIGFAQTKTVTGTVTDQDGLPLPGVNILIKGENSGTQSDFDGNYSINASSNQTLVYRYVGFKTQNIRIGDKSLINVQLSIESGELDEVIITGYASSSKTRSTISSETVTAKTIENRPNASFVQTLSGQVAGLNISSASGQPGANSTVNIRGVSSINGNTEPLFIIDGAPVDEDNFRSLNPQDIESIDVLKDAAATAIYGNRGANGVIVIQTRRGDLNTKLNIRYNGIVSTTYQQDQDYDLMNSQEKLRLERDFGAGLGVGLTDEEINSAETYEWIDFFFNPGITQNHTLSLSSGGASNTQFTSLGFSETDGLLIDSDLTRFNLRNNFSGSSENDKFNYNTSLTLNYSKSNEPNNIGTGAVNRNYILGAYQSLPYITPDLYTNGQDLFDGVSFLGNDVGVFQATPLLLLDRVNSFRRLEEEVKIVGSINATYKITDNITATSTTSIDYQDIIVTSAEGPESFNAINFAEVGNNTPGTQTQSSRRDLRFNHVNSIGYSNTSGKHSYDFTAFTEYFKAHLRTFGYTNSGLVPNTFAFQDGAGYVDDNADNDFFGNTVFAQKRDAGLFSYFGSANYDFDNKYGFSGTVRRDASYRFAGDNTWGTFWSVGGRWNIDAEDFMENTTFDVLKLRASYGTAGNQRVTGTTPFSAPDLYLNLFGTGSGYNGQNSLFLSQIANNTLRWETVQTANLGIDFGLFNSKLRGNVDVYERKTVDLFQSTPISAINGTTALNANTGSLFNRGFDFQINYNLLTPQERGDLGVSFSVNGNYNRTELQDLPSDDGEIIGIGRNGGQLFEYYAVRYAGVNPANGELLYLDIDGNVTESPNADTDRVWLDKNIFPDFNGGFSLNVDFKNFFLTTQFNYVMGVDRFDFERSGYVDPNTISNFRTSRDLLRAWTPDNRITDIPALTANNYTLLGAGESNRFITNANYLRLRFAQIGYNFPSEQLEKMGFSALRVFANGENLVTFSEWRGLDAEAQSNTSRLYPTPRIVSFGLEVSF
jgi:TonB-linked SusC/RagA family outer membrane protein